MTLCCHDDALGEEGALEASQELDNLLTAHATANYVLAVAEDATASSAAVAAATGAAATATVGVVAVDASSGDVMYGLCNTGLVQSDLESVLISVNPSEVVAIEPLSSETERLISSYLATAKQCRLEKVPGSCGYLDSGVMDKISSFFSKKGTQNGNSQEDSTAITSTTVNGALEFVLGLPPLVLRALWVAVEYLTPFGLSGLLNMTQCYRPLSAHASLRLSSNALRQLEVLTTGNTVQYMY